MTQPSFASGELTPSLWARTDHVRYHSSCRTCRNFMVMRHGGLTNRPGTRFVCETKFPTKKVRLLPFIFNASLGNTYILEFGDQYMRVIKAGALLTVSPAPAISGIARANTTVITTSTNHGFNTGDYVILDGIVGTVQLNKRQFKIVKLSNTTFEILTPGGAQIDSAAYGAWVSGGTAAKVYEIATPYLEAQLPLLQFAQSADVMTITLKGVQPRELARTADTSWELTPVSFQPLIGPPTENLTGTRGRDGNNLYEYVVTSTDEKTLEESLPSEIIQVTAASAPISSAPHTVAWSAVDGAREYNVYRRQEGIFGFVGITQETSFRDRGVEPDILDSPPEEHNLFQAANDYPAVVGSYQQRRILANTPNDPERLWGSKTGSSRNFSKSFPLQDDDMIAFTILDSLVSEIQHVLDLGALILFTASSEHKVGGPGEAFTPFSINRIRQSQYGCGTLRPLIVGDTALFLQARANVVRDLLFQFETDGYRGNEVSLFSSHLFTGYTLVDWDYQQIPHSMVWGIRSDGTLLGLTYVREQAISGWTRHDTKNGSFENVAVIPEGSEDAPYFALKRTINGQDVRYIETLASRTKLDVGDLCILDSAVSYDGAPTNEVTGLWHLEGQQVGILADGAVIASPNNATYAKVTVTNGKVTLAKAASVIHVGLPITADMQTLRLSNQVIKALVTAVRMSVESSRGIWLGGAPPDDDAVDPLQGLVEERARTDEGYDQPPGLRTEVLDVNIEGRWNTTGEVFIRQVDPLPLTILSIEPAGLVPISRAA